MLDGLFTLLAGVLAFFYDLIPNYAVAIVLLTFAVMLVLAPITLRGTRSMLAIQRLQPEVKRIQDEHKGDRQAANEALMAFYKEHKVNPLSGCLPMVAQFPVLIVMYNVILGLVNKGGPKYLSQDSALYSALKESNGRMVSFGVDFARKASDGGAQALPLYVLVALVVVTGYWQVRQMQARSSSAQAQNPQAQMITKVLPLFSGLFSLTLPAGVALYFLVSNLFRIAQQSLMYRFDPALAATVKRNVAEIESKTVERERAHREQRGRTGRSKPSTPPAPKDRGGGGRTTPTGRNGGRPSGSRKKSKRRKR